MLRAVDEQPQPAMTLLLGRDGAVLEEQQPLEAIFPLKEEAVDLRKAERTRRTSKILAGEETINEEQVDDDENVWGKSKENIHDEETGIFSPIIMRLPEDVQQVLMVAACLGSLDSRLLQASTSSSEDEVSRCLAAAMENGLIKKTQAMHVFSTEDAKKDAYRAIPLRERGRFHVAIGRNLARNLSEDEQEKHVSIVLLQFHRGAKDITNNRERKAIVVLCLRGVQWAVSGSDFRSACNYSDLGVLLLGANSWTEEYDLSLALYNDFVEVLYCIANYEKMDAVVSEVLKNAKCFRDTLRVRSTRVFSLCSRYRMAEALKEGLDALHHLGEAFPAKPRKNHVVVEFMRTRRVLLRTSNEMILRMPLMEDVDKIAAMQMLNLTISTAYHTNPLMMLLMIMRMVQITVRFGLSAVSTVGFAAYSAVFCSISKDKDQGYRYSQLALALLDKFQTREWIPRVYVFVYAEAGPYKCHIAKLCPHLHYAHQVGLETGDMEFAVVASVLYLAFMSVSGQSLLRFEQEAIGFFETAESKKQESGMLFLRPSLQFVRKMMGETANPRILMGDIFRQEDLTRIEEAHDELFLAVVHFIQMLLAYIFSDFKTAAKEAESLEQVLYSQLIHPGFSSFLAYYSVALLTITNLHHGYARRRLISKARRSLKKLKQFSNCIAENALDKVFLVEAELAAVMGNYTAARDKYMIAIALAGEFGDLMLRAIACERAASFLRDRGDDESSSYYFREAHSAYTRWGGIAKVEQLEKEMPELFSTNE